VSNTTPGQFPDLEPCEALVTDGEALLYRQVHPGLIVNGEPGSHAFRPGSNDDGKLSAQDGTTLTPQEAWSLYTETLGLSSVGVWGITVAEAQAASRRVIDDASCPAATPHHRSIDFRDIADARRQRERDSTLLKRAALQRGVLHLA
jgi:hypothetical protein